MPGGRGSALLTCPPTSSPSHDAAAPSGGAGGHRGGGTFLSLDALGAAWRIARWLFGGSRSATRSQAIPGDIVNIDSCQRYRPFGRPVPFLPAV